MSTPTTLTPAEAWAELQRGNERFIAGEPRHPRQDADRREELAYRQYPIAGIFGCSDSRLAAEMIFDLGLGDAFVIRNAGQIASDSAIGSIEYAVGILQVPLLLVLGHDRCGAVRAAIDSQAADAQALPPHIADLIAPIAPAVRSIAGIEDGATLDPEAVDAGAVGREHLRNTIGALLRDSEMISEAVAEGKLAIVGANYQLVEGRVAPHIAVGLDLDLG
ncbi:carbonic anhydrase [Microbacterium sp. STN6]|uniref:carbonic anhydrase n=1 Tax=Microbacterium sp. STN6 TaxID=2995588 RepID=UPI002260B046|nr:carbonic anhydrase [Microbacterium sp. STN6]MCX7521870.1 carbonic anhydrase [Microbacterium sp. STN6]